MSEEVPFTYARAVGDRLRDLRRQRGLSLLAVEEASHREFKASVLGAYERGERVISVLRLQRLAELYRVPVDQILPRSSGNGTHPGGAGHEEARAFVPKRPVRIDLSRLAQVESPEGEVIRRYLNMIQKQRSDFTSRSLAIRDEDLRALARFFQCDERSMEVRLADLGLHY